jgi:hypothetical protein
MTTDPATNPYPRQPHIGDAFGRILARCWDADATPWSAQGHEVVGLDPSPEAVRVSGERGVKAVVGSVPSLPDGLGQFGRGRARGRLRIRVRDGATATPWFEYWLATPDELSTAVAESAWTLESLDRDPTGPGYVVRLRLPS